MGSTASRQVGDGRYSGGIFAVVASEYMIFYNAHNIISIKFHLRRLDDF